MLYTEIFLNSILVETEKIDFDITPAMATVLIHSSSLWSSSLTPSGLAACVISLIDVFAADTLHKGIVLGYLTRHEISSASLKLLTKSQILFLVDIESMIDIFKALETLVRICWSNKPIPTRF